MIKQVARRLSGNYSCSIASLVISLLLSPVMPQTVHAAEELKFAWPVPSQVTVTENTLKKGKTAKTRYDIVLSKQAKGNNYEVRFEHFQFLDINGMDLSVPENKKQLGPMLAQMNAMGSMIPTLVVNPQGQVEDVIGMEEAVTNALKVMPAADPQMIAALKSPAMIAQMKEKSVDFWRVWVETWVLSQPAPGKPVVVEMEIPVVGGAVKSEMTVKNEGAAPGSAGDVQLSAQAVLQGEAAKKALGALMQSLIAQVPAKPGTKPFSPAMIKDMKRTTRFSVVTNPKTLQPVRAHSETLIDLAIGDERKSQLEKHEYSFAWPAPVTP